MTTRQRVIPEINLPQISDHDWQAATVAVRSDGGYEAWKAEREAKAAADGRFKGYINMIFASFREGLIEEREAHALVDSAVAGAELGMVFPPAAL